ncbi:MAG: serine hydrolase [Bacilli bacterium]|nr:serine hydrolase [Bacilli bacterium]
MNIEKTIKDSLINFNGKVAIYYDDLKGNIIKINEKEKYNAASCIKIFILVELFNQIKNDKINRNLELIYLDKHHVNGSGVLQYLSKGIKLPILDVATLMMIISDNVATNMLIDFLGIENINNTIENIGCKDTKLYSKFKSVEDEVFSETTAYDYYLIWKKLNNYELFDKEITQEIIDIIKNQKYQEMVGDGIDKIYKEVDKPVVNYMVTKSGKYQSVRNDGGIVSTKYGNYIFVIFIKDFKDENYLNDEYVYNQGRKISNIIFNKFIRRENI